MASVDKGLQIWLQVPVKAMQLWAKPECTGTMMADRASELMGAKGQGGNAKLARKRFGVANSTQPASKHWRLQDTLTVWLASWVSKAAYEGQPM